MPSIAQDSSLSTINITLDSGNTSLSSMDSKLSTINSTIGSSNSALSTTNATLGTINTSIGTTNTTLSTTNTSISSTNSALATTNGKLDTVNTSITSTNTALSTTNGSLSTANSTLNQIHTDLGTTLHNDLGLVATENTLNAVKTRLPSALGEQNSSNSISIVPCTSSNMATDTTLAAVNSSVGSVVTNTASILAKLPATTFYGLMNGDSNSWSRHVSFATSAGTAGLLLNPLAAIASQYVLPAADRAVRFKSSSPSDTGNYFVRGVSRAGAYVSETITGNGATYVTLANTYALVNDFVPVSGSNVLGNLTLEIDKAGNTFSSGQENIMTSIKGNVASTRVGIPTGKKMIIYNFQVSNSSNTATNFTYNIAYRPFFFSAASGDTVDCTLRSVTFNNTVPETKDMVGNQPIVLFGPSLVYGTFTAGSSSTGTCAGMSFTVCDV